MDCSTSGFPAPYLEFAQVHTHGISMPSNHLILCCPLFLLLSIFPSIRVFSFESAVCIRWPSIGASALALSFQWVFRVLLPLCSSVGKESTCNVGDSGSIPVSGEGTGYPLQYSWASLVAQRVKDLPAMREMGLIPGLETFPGGGLGNPLQYSCRENPHGQRSLAGYSPRGRKESDTTEWFHFTWQCYSRKNCLSILLTHTNPQKALKGGRKPREGRSGYSVILEFKNKISTGQMWRQRL